ncbi:MULTISPECIES: putative entry exclusion protein TrbK-alt [unclassified Shinella]|jgi:conjugative transfer region protein TrbK|uniref:putative entry exclusion protein TrbK-alt n=1 Tax=unclassified Shinella TaxID=2643062 RepID=UPI00225CB769|nr:MULTISPECIES: putative entry exclusion protein TrbK-alt [unclassified Shinella]MCO5140548.1 putative entry exclusion protein TrbK-alt [Shinella sp.]MDC7254730.1 putative entry exclusion protein TrbK-alt [Shinella sp. YE25]CAI0337462.1 Conjugal transfer protein TrbK [Rhizobiaceae bacterium]CAK7255952.1 Conjugal transfer protein TrbK [Shinella sp. WSC3-e]
MDGKMLARLGAVVFVAVAITATAIEMTRKEEAPSTEPVRLIEPSRDPLREGQRRCQQLGQRAIDDTECLRVWAETRDRFLGRSQQPAPPTASEGR